MLVAIIWNSTQNKEATLLWSSWTETLTLSVKKSMTTNTSKAAIVRSHFALKSTANASKPDSNVAKIANAMSAKMEEEAKKGKEIEWKERKCSCFMNSRWRRYDPGP